MNKVAVQKLLSERNGPTIPYYNGWHVFLFFGNIENQHNVTYLFKEVTYSNRYLFGNEHFETDCSFRIMSGRESEISIRFWSSIRQIIIIKVQPKYGSFETFRLNNFMCSIFCQVGLLWEYTLYL